MKWLDFWLACRALDDLAEAKDGGGGDGVRAQLGRMSKDFFGSSGGGVSLSNDSVRKECAQICSKQKGSDLRPMWLAQGCMMDDRESSMRRITPYIA